MRPLNGARPERRHPDREKFSVVDERLLGPGAREHLDRFLHPVTAVVAPETEADVLVLVVAGAASDADLQPPATQVVEHGELNGEAHGMVERHLDDGEPEPRARGTRRERAGMWNSRKLTPSPSATRSPCRSPIGKTVACPRPTITSSPLTVKRVRPERRTNMLSALGCMCSPVTMSRTYSTIIA